VGLAVVDQDSSLASRLTRSALGQGPIAELIEVVDATDVPAVTGLFESQRASAAVIIPDGFGDRLLRMEPDTLLVYRNPRHTIGPQIAEGVLGALTTLGNGLLGQFSQPMQRVRASFDRGTDPSVDEIGEISKSFFLAARSARGLSGLQKIDVSVVKEKDDQKEEGFNLAAMFFPGLIMFGLLSVSVNLERRFLVDRTRHVTHRLVTAPLSPWRVAVEQRLYTASFVYIVGVLSATVGGLIWRIPAHGLATANLITIALSLFVSGFCGLVFSLSNSVRAVSAISSISMTFLSILGGGFFPAELTPPAFQSVVKWIPTGMANLGLTHCLTGRELGISIPVLFLYCGAFFVAGTFMGRRRII
jgi:ABC-type polysaccharide/polyol phosphate export permease